MTSQAAGNYTGTVFQDYNGNGTRDLTNTVAAVGEGNYAAAVDRAISGITVTLTDSAGTSVTTVTNANGEYTLNSSALAAGPYRLEFTGYEGQSLFSGPNTANAQTGTSVQFVADGGGAYNFAVNSPNDYCQDDPLLVTQCYVFGEQISGANSNQPVLVSYPFGAGSENTPAEQSQTDLNNQPTAHTDVMVGAVQIGTTFGVGYDRQNTDLYVAAYTKRHTGYGPNGIGAIYRVNPDVSASAGTFYFDMNTLPGNPAGTDYRAAAGHDYDRDDAAPVGTVAGGQAALDAIGKIGLGGMATDSFGRFLYVVALGNRTLYRLPIVPGGVPNPADIISQPIPTDGCPGGPNDARPFPVSYTDWAGTSRLYIGVTCTGETNDATTEQRILIYQGDPDTLAINATPVFTTNLIYPRGRANDRAGQIADWRPWSNEWTDALVDSGGGLDFTVNPQPYLTSLAFDRGNMIFSVRDRWGDQIGSEALSEPGTNTRWRVVTAGDILRVCGNPTTGWTLESAGSCPDGSGAGTVSAIRPQGPGGAEFYAGDEYEPHFDGAQGDISGVSGTARHDETGMGAAVQIPGFPDVASLMFDPAYNSAGSTGFNSGGVRWLSNTTGLVTRSYTLYDVGAPGSFEKANGLGDIVAFCDLPPLEIGNRVWEDTNGDGIQDPNEPSFGGVTVSLWEDTNGDGTPDVYVTSAITSGTAGRSPAETNAGQYLFVENGQGNGISGTAELPTAYNGGRWRYGTNYIIRLDRAEDYGTGGILDSYAASPPNAGGAAANMRDSDGVAAAGTGTSPVPPGFSSLDGVQFAQAAVNIGFNGQHNHTYDFGLNQLVPVPTATPPPTAVPGSGAQTSGDISVGTSFGTVTTTKQVDPPFANVGDTVRWTVTLANPDASATLTDVGFTDPIDPRLELLEATASRGTATIDGANVIYRLDSLAPDETVTVTITTRIRASAINALSIPNDVNGAVASVIVGITELPQTGETPRRVLLLGLMLAAGAGALLAARRRMRPTR